MPLSVPLAALVASTIAPTLVAPPTLAAPIYPSPGSAAGVQRMFDNVPTSSWGGADVTLSLPLSRGRNLWLFGDTITPGKPYAHSTAMVQKDGRLRVANGARQILPNDSSGNIYWIEAAKYGWKRDAGGDFVYVTAAPMKIGTNGAWDFRRASSNSRVARLYIRSDGEVFFKEWVKYVPAPAPFNDLHWDKLSNGDIRYRYERRCHPEFKTKAGYYVKSVNQNWSPVSGGWKRTSSGKIDYRAYRARFYDSTTCKRS